MRPIVVKGVDSSMDIYHEESFGPSVSLILVENEDEAIKIANDREYGLTAGMFTRSLETATALLERSNLGKCT